METLPVPIPLEGWSVGETGFPPQMKNPITNPKGTRPITNQNPQNTERKPPFLVFLVVWACLWAGLGWV